MDIKNITDISDTGRCSGFLNVHNNPDHCDVNGV